MRINNLHPSINPHQLADDCKTYRIAHRLTQVDLSVWLGLPQGQVSIIERGGARVAPGAALKIANALKSDPPAGVRWTKKTTVATPEMAAAALHCFTLRQSNRLSQVKMAACFDTSQPAIAGVERSDVRYAKLAAKIAAWPKDKPLIPPAAAMTARELDWAQRQKKAEAMRAAMRRENDEFKRLSPSPDDSDGPVLPPRPQASSGPAHNPRHDEDMPFE